MRPGVMILTVSELGQRMRGGVTQTTAIHTCWIFGQSACKIFDRIVTDEKQKSLEDPNSCSILRPTQHMDKTQLHE